MLENFLNGFKGDEWKINSIKSRHEKIFKKNACPLLRVLFKRVLLVFQFKKIVEKNCCKHMYLKKVILILILRLLKIIKNIIFHKKLTLKYACLSALCVDHARIGCFWKLYILN